MKNKVIVFGCNHQNMLGLVRSLGEKGIKPYCVCLKSNKGLVFSSKYPAECHFAESPQAGYDYIVRNFSKETNKPILLSSDDMTETLFDVNASELRKSFIVPASDEDGKLTRLMSKKNIAELAANYGFKLPWMKVINKGEAIPEELIYPVFTKSVKSIDGGKKEECKCINKEELETVLKECRSEGLLVQQFIDKVDEIDFIGYTANGNVYLPYVQHQLRFSDHAYGGYHRFDKVEENQITTGIRTMLKDINFQGLFSVEFLVDRSGEWYFTEVNFRHDGHDYLITNAGINLPWLYCCAVTGEDVDLQPDVVRRSFTGMNEIIDFGQFVCTKQISMIKWFWQFITADTHIMWNWRDMGPIWYMLKKKK